MSVEGPDPRDSRSILADWIELRAVVTSAGSRADIVRLQERLSDHDHETLTDPTTDEVLEEEILETESSWLAESVSDELDFRSDTLRDAFPFDIRTRSSTWSVHCDPDRLATPGGCTYLFCLLVSAIRDKRLPVSTIGAERMGELTALFQDLAYLSALRFMGGSGMSFGYPRPDGSRFLDALRAFAESFEVGEARREPPPASLRKEKDEGIDVIVWRSFSDRRAGKLLMLGQVASGGNWRDKSVKQDVDHFLDWFTIRPMHHYIPAMFIPFPQHHEFRPIREVAYDLAVRDACRADEIAFGLIFDRLRIVETVRGAADGDLGDLLPRLRRWSDDVLAQVRGA